MWCVLTPAPLTAIRRRPPVGSLRFCEPRGIVLPIVLCAARNNHHQCVAIRALGRPGEKQRCVLEKLSSQVLRGPEHEDGGMVARQTAASGAALSRPEEGGRGAGRGARARAHEGARESTSGRRARDRVARRLKTLTRAPMAVHARTDATPEAPRRGRGLVSIRDDGRGARGAAARAREHLVMIRCSGRTSSRAPRPASR